MCPLLMGPVRSEERGCGTGRLWRALQEPSACPVGGQREQTTWHCTPGPKNRGQEGPSHDGKGGARSPPCIHSRQRRLTPRTANSVSFSGNVIPTRFQECSAEPNPVLMTPVGKCVCQPFNPRPQRKNSHLDNRKTLLEGLWDAPAT